MAALAKTRRERAEKFNGSAAYLRSPAKGLRVSPDGRAEQDEFAMVEVVTATSTEAGGALTRQC